MLLRTATSIAIALTCACFNAQAADYSPNVGANAPKKLLWGDTHLHSSWSADSGAVGNRLGPEAAVRFSRGEEVTSSTGQKVRLERPLDWVVVADHSEGLGMVQELINQSPAVMADETGARWAKLIASGGKGPLQVYIEMVDAQSGGRPMPEFIKEKSVAMDIWKKNTAIQEKYNEPGRFTTLIGYEWTSVPGGDNLHRNVIFRDGKDKADAMSPFTSWDSQDPAELWKWMQAWEEKTGGKLLAIPHNGNLSNGKMFALADFLGNPMTRAYAEARARWEPVYETTQIKGDSEAHQSLSPTDEFANFERWDTANLNGVPKKPEQIQYEYARQALKNGLLVEGQLGANPFKYGLIGSTDSHTALTTADENNFYGKYVAVEPSPTRAMVVKKNVTGWQYSASGRAAVWAQDNTREAIWDALKRKEVYATTGSRISVRLFAGYDFAVHDAERGDFAEMGYAKGVPMGGELKAAPKGKAPMFAIQAAKDPLGGNLDRVQVIKGWLDAKGQVQEKVYDVAWSGRSNNMRKPGKNGKLPAVGNTVDVKDATWSNSIGAAGLSSVWRDPAFNPTLKAFYYVRVIEIPTPRWTAYDAKRFGVIMPPGVPMIVTDRAYTSPVWYSPS